MTPPRIQDDSPPLEVLIVDDSAVMRAMIARTLRLSGVPLASVRQAPNGAACLAALRSQPAHLVLLDINMPDMSGEEVLARIRADASLTDAAVLVVSSESSETRHEAIRRLGARFVHKPFTPEQLADAIRGLTGWSDAPTRFAPVPHGEGDF